MCLKRWSTIFDGQGYYSTSTNCFADAVIEGIKGGLRVDDTAQAIVSSDNDTAVMAIMHAIP